MIVFDSDVLIDFLRGAGPGADRVALELRHGQVTIAAVTAFELEAGAKTPRSQRAVTALLDAVTVLPLSPAQSREAGRIFRELRGRGQEIGMADCLIAATCLEHSALLVTRNMRHFARIDGVALATP